MRSNDGELVQECVPERLDLKHETLSAIDAAAPTDALVASSTSGFKPTDLAAALQHPERLVVGHPFNPVYLLPLVEVVGGEQTSLGTLDRAMAVYADLGMQPLHVRVEIDAFIADRLLEAVWREAIWLVNDGVATTEEIDDAIRYGFGLRWAQMGLFETYRTAGGSRRDAPLPRPVRPGARMAVVETHRHAGVDRRIGRDDRRTNPTISRGDRDHRGAARRT